ncbi:MAG TPA: M14 metallopeptidase family protein [Candidatus Polarisedimenticolia bacterium]|nr:M14 metallopeptidase family protein [Candidatus Polarisedimenticolia bacterium]
MRAVNIHCSSKAILGLVAILLLTPILGLAQTSPQQFLGFHPGTDRRLADYTQIVGYLQKLASESPRVKVVNIGETVLKKPIVMAIITTPENMKNLDRYKQVNHRLRDARGLTPEAAAKLAADGKVIIAMGCSIHSTEIGASQMSLELAYRLAKGDAPFEVEKVLSDVIVLLIPSVNPDGEQMVTEWYRKYVGTEYEGGPMPWLYHHYAGHDDNRDFYMFNLPEVRAEGGVLFRDWLPQIFISEHQSGITSPRQFVSPYGDPFLPDVNSLVWTGIDVMGANIRYALDGAGKTGITHNEGYTGWWTGGEDEVSWTHNIMAFLTEAASARVATPIYVSPNQLPESLTRVGANTPHPWLGGWWHLQDIVDNELILNFAAIRTAHEHKIAFLLNSYKMNKEGIEAPGGEGGFVISADQHDPLTATKMVNALLLGGLEVQQAQDAFVAGGKSYPAASFIVPLAQPYRAQAITLLDRQKYPDIRQYSEGPPIAPYDNAGWTLPYLMGVSTDRISEPIHVRTRPVEEAAYPAGKMPSDNPAYMVLDPSLNASYAVAAGVLAHGGSVSRTLAPAIAGRQTFAPGAFVIKQDRQGQSTISDLLTQWHITPAALNSTQGMKLGALKASRIGLYQSYQNNMDEGWTRYVLDDLHIPYVTLHNLDVKEGGLANKFDVLILPAESRDTIVTGKRGAQPGRPDIEPNLPPEYSGGIGEEGLQAIRAFIKSGGTLVTVNEACGLAMKDMQVPVRDALGDVDHSKFFVPNSIIRITVDPNEPLGFGMPTESAAMFSGSRQGGGNSLAMDIFDSGKVNVESRIAASYPGENELLSGWMVGGERMTGKASVVDIKDGKGRIVMFGFRPLFRAQSHGTYKLFLNALYYPDTGTDD